MQASESGSDSRLVEVWEIQQLKRGVWLPDDKTPWVAADKSISVGPDEYPSPEPGWIWGSNWRYEVKQNMTDREGWEYGYVFSVLIGTID
jgi:hypothetical protein